MRPWLLAFLVLTFTSHAFAHGDLHEQIEALTTRLRRHPTAELFHKRAELYRAHGDYDAAFADYDRAEQVNPSLEVVHLSRGRSLLEAGRPREAVRELSAFIAHHAGHGEALLLRARAHERLGERMEAERNFAAALDATKDPTPDLFLERASNLSASGDATKALTLLEAALRRLGPIVSIEQTALQLELKLARYEAALARVEDMLSRVARKEALLAQKAEVLEQAGRVAQARSTREQALVAIEALPPAKRKLQATKELERDLRVALSR